MGVFDRFACQRRSTSQPKPCCPPGILEPLEPRLLLSGDIALATTDVTIGDGAPKSVIYTDVDGTSVVVSLKGGTATVRFTGDNLQQAPGKKGVVVTGNNNNVVLVEVVLAGTTGSGALTFKTKGGDRLATVGEITGGGAFSKLTGKGVDLIGSGIVLAAGGYIGSIQLHDIKNGADIIMPGTGAAKGIKIKLNQLDAGTDITLGSYLKSLAANQWVGSSLTAPWASKITIKGNFGADVTLSGAGPKGLALVKLAVSGAITDSVITANAGGVGSVKAAQWDAGSLNTPWVKAVATKGKGKGATGNFGASMYLSGVGAPKGMTMKSAKIAGDLIGGVWRIIGNAGSLRANLIRSDVSITGNVKSIKINDYLTTVRPVGGAIARIQIGGTVSIRTASQRIKGSGLQLYPGAGYDLEDQLRHFNQPGAWWDYNVSYIVDGERGTDVTHVEVDSVTNNGGSTSYDVSAVSSSDPDSHVLTSWFKDPQGVHQSSWLLGMGSGQYVTIVYAGGQIIATPSMIDGQTYSGSAPFSGVWKIIYDGQDINGEASGTANQTTKLIGLEQVTVPTGTYNAIKGETKVAANGSVDFWFEGTHYTGTVKVTETQTWWFDPEVGGVKASTSETITIAVSGVGSWSYHASADQVLIDYSLGG